jgi:hypothetical protein
VGTTAGAEVSERGDFFRPCRKRNPAHTHTSGPACTRARTHTHTHTHIICNTYCFSTATMVMWTRLSVTLHVHCLTVFHAFIFFFSLLIYFSLSRWSFLLLLYFLHSLCLYMYVCIYGMFTFLAFCETRRFITVFTKACQLPVPWATSVYLCSLQFNW